FRCAQPILRARHASGSPSSPLRKGVRAGKANPLTSEVRPMTTTSKHEQIVEAAGSVAEHETLFLSERDREVFLEALVNPPVPSERLKRAFAEHKRRVAQ